MNNSDIRTLAFIFDNKTDHILLLQVSEQGPLFRKHTGIKDTVGLLEDTNQAAIRSIRDASGLEVAELVLRGVIKVIYSEAQTSAIYFVYESSRFSGELENKISGRLKWVDILNIFNLPMEGLVQELMPNLLDGESFFEGTIYLNGEEEVVSWVSGFVRQHLIFTFAAMIDQATIERIVDAAHISDVVSEFVTLKKRGVNQLGLCPFHNEKTPSFTVSPAKGIFKCFGCGKGGNSVNFIMELEQLSYPDALRWLAKKFHIEIEEKEESQEEKQQKDERESMMIASAFAQKYFSRFLLKENEGRTIGLSYLRERGIRDDIITKFELGYCPDGKDIFTQAAQREGYKMEFLEKTGLTIKRDDWVRDRFGGRVIFPVHNVAGRVIAFGGRTLTNDKKVAKYLNSPESEIYHKGRTLYGIYQAKRDITRLDKCYLVEGYTDVLSFHQAGIENLVASSGTSLTIDQIRLIRRFSPNITIVYDGDDAGIKASLRGIDMVLEEGINVKVLPLPRGEDPDSFARSMSASQLAEYIKAKETDFIKFKTQLLMETVENDPVSKARLINEIVHSISVIPDTITRTIYIKECSRLMDVQEAVLYSEIRKIQNKQSEDHTRKEIQELQIQASKPAVVPSEKKIVNPFETEEREILRILLKYFHQEVFEIEDEQTHQTNTYTVGVYVLSELQADGLESVNPKVKFILSELEKNHDNKDFDPIKFFTQYPDAEISQYASHVLAEKYIESKRWSRGGAFIESESEILYLLVPKLIQEYKLKNVKLMLKKLEHQINEANKSGETETMMECMNQHMNLKKVLKELSELLGFRTIS